MSDLEKRILSLAVDYLSWSWFETVPSHGNLDRQFAENLLRLIQGYIVTYSFNEEGKPEIQYIPNTEGEKNNE